MPCALSEAQAHIPHGRRRPPLRCGGLEAARARARGHYRGGAAEVQAGGEEEGFSEDLMFFVATYLSELTTPSSPDSSFRPARRLRPDGRGWWQGSLWLSRAARVLTLVPAPYSVSIIRQENLASIQQDPSRSLAGIA
ncbi:uncharacterized protein [Miscanthus floridulus]|uniref:uncharacterized protein isoform X4 n=1 Tax=Miscanthus floridulus TaxID=154761 RepID=UPI00345A21EB